MWRYMDHNRGTVDQTNTEAFNKEFSEHVTKKTNEYPDGATMPDLADSHCEDMAKLIEAASSAGADMTALEAVAEYMATVLLRGHAEGEIPARVPAGDHIRGPGREREDPLPASR
ncbi:hypothetical protein CYMTET_18229 [Cymbomonas tetramitiformis]|uniref:Uncharacterized protein n=1 Tax=Cymbomonas tetramitiformis TaxID=36881 RepID=A0AAE0G8J2_9CHLO|nr:hypothetical protein CYMTET_18229 [Cymbomonas tetramitiformis]